MKKFWETVLKVLETIVGVILAFIGAILISPFVVLYVLFALPCAVIADIWDKPEVIYSSWGSEE